MRALALLLVVALVAGCASPQDVDTSARQGAGAPRARTAILDGVIEPPILDAPTFRLLGAVASGGPVYGAGEPNIWAHLDGTLFVAFAGCDTGPYYIVPARLPGQAPCGHGPVYRSTDRGETWKRLNDAETGRLAPPGAENGPNANNDNDVAVDSTGVVYVSNLGTGIHVQKSLDGGDTWRYVGNVVPRTNPNTTAAAAYNSDRNWIAAAGAGHLINAWMGSAPAPAGGTSPSPRAVGINTTFDGGETWVGATYVSKSIGWLGSPQFAPDGMTAYIPFTKGGDAAAAGETREFELRVARTLDGGRTWEDVDTGTRIEASSQGGHWSGVHMAPALDVTADGTVVYAWSEEAIGPGGLNSIGSRVLAITSHDQGVTWSAPMLLSERTQAILPWVVGGAGDRFAVTYYSGDVEGDADYVPMEWRLDIVVVDGTDIVRTIVDPLVHVGNICTRGGGCTHPVSDRELLDFFESDALPDGNIVIVYPADDARDGKAIEQRFAVQTGGAPLWLAGS